MKKVFWGKISSKLKRPIASTSTNRLFAQKIAHIGHYTKTVKCSSNNPFLLATQRHTLFFSACKCILSPSKKKNFFLSFKYGVPFFLFENKKKHLKGALLATFRLWTTHSLTLIAYSRERTEKRNARRLPSSSERITSFS